MRVGYDVKVGRNLSVGEGLGVGNNLKVGQSSSGGSRRGGGKGGSLVKGIYVRTSRLMDGFKWIGLLTIWVDLYLEMEMGWPVGWMGALGYGIVSGWVGRCTYVWGHPALALWVDTWKSVSPLSDQARRLGSCTLLNVIPSFLTSGSKCNLYTGMNGRCEGWLLQRECRNTDMVTDKGDTKHRRQHQTGSIESVRENKGSGIKTWRDKRYAWS